MASTVGLGADLPKRTGTVQVCTNPTGIAINSLTDQIFVACSGGSVTIIDGGTKETTTLPVGRSSDPGSFSIAVDSTRNRAFVVNRYDGSVTVLDRTTGESREVVLGFSPGAQVVVNTVSNKIYIARDFISPHGGQGFRSIFVIDGSTMTSHEIPVGTVPFGIAVDETRDRIYVANAGDLLTASNTLTIIDGATESTRDLVVGNGPTSVAIDPVRDLVAVANFGGYGPASISLVDASTLSVTSIPIPTEGDHPHQVVVNSATGKIYVASDVLSVLEVDEGTLAVKAIPVSNPVWRLAVNSSTNTVYAIHQTEEAGFGQTAVGHTVSVIDGATHETVKVQVGVFPQDIQVNQVTDTTWVANTDASTVSVLYGESAMCFPCTRVVPFRPVTR